MIFFRHLLLLSAFGLFVVSCEEINPNNSETYVTNVNLQGRITDSCGAAPYANKPVFWYEGTFSASVNDEFIAETTTDANGYFSFTDVPFSYRAKTRNDGITGISRSRIEVCIDNELVGQRTIATGFLGKTEFSEGDHDSNLDLGNLNIHGNDLTYRILVPKTSPAGNPLSFDDYRTPLTGATVRSFVVDSSDLDWFVLDCVYRDYEQYFIYDTDFDQVDQHNAGIIFSIGNVTLIDEVAQEKLSYSLDRIHYRECGEKGDFYPTLKETQPL